MSDVVGAEGTCAEWSFPARPGAVRAARHAVRDTLRGWGVDETARDLVVLLVSELVTNSQRYTAGPVGVRLVPLVGPDPSAPPSALRVEVSDPLPDPPVAKAAHPEDEGGRGLQLVACSARRWGTRRGRTGKTVWFELALTG
ncbi:ATP-binding protein [Streptomyces sp. NPDC005805]|uniref:ATP-binding protein n=1 Tax=Streptomyces sp. NPDC005805 TaxID=3157068 RepID=UPI00340546E9